MTLKFADNLFEHILSNRHFFKDILDHRGIDSLIISFNRCNDQSTNVYGSRTDEHTFLSLTKINIGPMLAPVKYYHAPGIFLKRAEEIEHRFFRCLRNFLHYTNKIQERRLKFSFNF